MPGELLVVLAMCFGQKRCRQNLAQSLTPPTFKPLKLSKPPAPQASLTPMCYHLALPIRCTQAFKTYGDTCSSFWINKREMCIWCAAFISSILEELQYAFWSLYKVFSVWFFYTSTFTKMHNSPCSAHQLINRWDKHLRWAAGLLIWNLSNKELRGSHFNQHYRFPFVWVQLLCDYQINVTFVRINHLKG